MASESSSGTERRGEEVVPGAKDTESSSEPGTQSACGGRCGGRGEAAVEMLSASSNGSERRGVEAAEERHPLEGRGESEPSERTPESSSGAERRGEGNA